MKYRKQSLTITFFSLLFLLLFLPTTKVKAQQDPMYTQYMFNTQIINPAYAGTWDAMGFIALGRHQWIGFDGAPDTYTFSMQSPFKNTRRAAYGVNLMIDRIGRERLFGLFGDYSYKLNVGRTAKLRLGLKAGVTNYSNPLREYILDQAHDGMFVENFESELMVNFGLGAFLYDDHYYVGISTPKFIENTLAGNNKFSSEVELRHYFLMAGYVFKLGRGLDFKPSVLTKAVKGAPLQFDFSANFLLREKLWFGAMYRTQAAYGFNVQWIFDRNLRIGYALDLELTNIKKHSRTSHEIMVSYEFGFINKRHVSPRYF